VSRTVRWTMPGRQFQVIDDAWPAGGVGMRARLFYRQRDGWQPPLPDDIEPPPEAPVARSSGETGLIRRSTSPRRARPAVPDWYLPPDWQLTRREPWRLRR
jgi:hypothetical protein